MKIKSLLILVSTCVLLASCLKDKDQFGWDADKGSIVTGIFDKGYYGDAKSYVLNSNPPVENLADFLSLRFHAPRQNKPGSNIHVKLSLANSQTLVNAYNAAHQTNFLQLPANAYAFTSLEYDIPKDVGEVLVPFTLNKGNLNLANSYAIGVTISEVSEGVINELEKNIVVTFQVKNKYDGVYELTLRHDGWLAYGISSGLTGIYPSEISLVTAGANSVTLSYAGFGALQPGFTGDAATITGSTAFGATTPRYTFDLANDKALSVVNTTPDDGRGRTLFLDPATTTSGYNPATKVVYLEYYMTQNGRPDMRIIASYRYLRSR
jgi:Domain of unknown function (DUF1735)